MEITGSSAYYAGLGAIHTGQHRVDQAAGQIANTTAERTATSQSSDFQAERLRSVDRSQQMDMATSVVQMAVGKTEVELGAKVVKASDEMLGRIIDTYA
ncbi:MULTISPECIES: hypothetical protein [Pseudomonas]|uniref:Pyrroloquinoline quinone biosynthesis protein PqqE n=1 Tax=Pseudomonas putida S13.1.2 TaxID=1384061 RepID=A0AAU8SHC5_PSEPU|nr:MULTISPECIES: hypothetical protein [Pseudomonas]AJQ49439.1 pyrroloquinoline quinone biosynthesis protein PqqE [Pseudomonas putida S13.1.2]